MKVSKYVVLYLFSQLFLQASGITYLIDMCFLFKKKWVKVIPSKEKVFIKHYIQVKAG